MTIQAIQSYDVNLAQALNRARGKKNKGKLGKATVPINNSLNQDTFNKTDSYGLISELETIKDKNGKSIYKMQHIAQILKNVNEEPSRLEPIKELAYYSGMKGKDLARISYAKADTLNLVNEISKKTKSDGSQKYASSHLIKFSTLPAKDLERIKPLTDTTLKADEIVNIAQNDELDLKKLGSKIVAMEKECGYNSLESVSFKRDIYDPENAYVITGRTASATRSELLDKNLNRLAIDKTLEYVSPNGNSYEVRKTNDLRNNTISLVRTYINDKGESFVENQIRIVKDKNGKKIKTEYMTQSKVDGVYDVKYVYPNGKVEQISSGKIDKKTGIVSVKRDMKSLDGTRTQYLYENDPNGNRIIDYKITDEKGKTLLNYSQSLEVIDENHFISSKNGKVYEMTVSNDKNTLTVKERNTKKINNINLGRLLRGDKASMLNLLKKFPGEELIALSETTNILKGIKSLDDCCYWPDKKEIDVVDDFYSVLHELGHSKDNDKGIDVLTNTKEIQEVYDRERVAFNKAFPNAQREHIDYFIDMSDHYSGARGGLEETVAESNAILNTYNTQGDIAARTQYFQQYFPKTIAKLSEYLFK